MKRTRGRLRPAGAGIIRRVHRDVTISVSSDATDHLVDRLGVLEGVISLSLHRGASVKPRGDVITATVLNVDADRVLALVAEAGQGGPVSVTTSSVDSVTDSVSQPQIRDDHDEAVWEESETAMRRHTRINLNFVLTSFAGGVLAAVALISSSSVTSATALVAAGIISPTLQPLIRIGLAMVNRHGRRLPGALVSALVSWVVTVAAGLLTILVLRAGGHYVVDDFLRNRTAAEVLHPPVVNLIISAGGAVAGAVIVASGRIDSLAGPLVAVQLLPAAATTGMFLELGNSSAVFRGIARTGVDIAMVMVACLVVLTYKHLFVHGRRVPSR